MSAPGGGRARAVVVLVAALAALAGAGLVEWLDPLPTVTAAEPVSQPPAESGSWYCPYVGAPEETAVLSIAAVGDAEATVRVVRYPPDGARYDPAVTIPAGEQHDVRIDPGHATFPVGVHWEGGPVVAAWRVAAADHAAAPCAAQASERWYVAGLDSAEGATSRLHLFNPFTIDATVRVSFALPEGPVTLALTDNLVVPAGAAVPLDLADYQPEQPDLGAVVEVLAGRVIAAGEVRFAPRGDVTGPRGRVLIPASAEPGLAWMFPYARADEQGESWLSILNPGDREAAVELRVTDPSPDAGALGEVSVPAGGQVRVDLTDVADETEFSVTAVVVNEVPVVATRTTWLRTTAGLEGVGASTGGAPAREVALVGAGLGERRGQVVVLNPGTEAVRVTVDAGPGTPETWADQPVEPNDRLALLLTDLGVDRAAVAVRVHASGPVVAEIRSHTPTGALRFWSAIGVPEAAWRGPPERLPVRRDPSLSTRPWATQEAGG